MSHNRSQTLVVGYLITIVKPVTVARPEVLTALLLRMQSHAMRHCLDGLLFRDFFKECGTFLDPSTLEGEGTAIFQNVRKH
jgi:hypothetical protein